MADAPAGGLAEWQALAEPPGAAALAQLEGIDSAPAASVIERMRRGCDAATVAAAIECAIARTRARAKFGARAATLWCDRAGAEMASSPAVARHKAARFAAAGAARIDDLCCGIGGDLMELARVAEATGADLDPVRAWMAGRNAGCAVRRADALLEPGDAPFAHADPARRAGGARVVRGADLLPPLADLRAALRGRRGTAIKLGPGMDLAADELDADDEAEFVSERGTLVQQVLWGGALARAPGQRTATRACTGATVTGRAADPPAGDGRMRRVLLVPDPALERARLLGEFAGALGAADAAPGLGILTADAVPAVPPAGAGDDGRTHGAAAWFEAWEVVEELPARERTVADWLRARGAGIVTVRTRGGACDPDEWQRALRGAGDEPWTVFVLRLGGERRAYAVRRAGAAGG
jgi:hypothetical protein